MPSALANGMVPFVFQFGLQKAWSLQIGFLSGVTEQEGAFQNHIYRAQTITDVLSAQSTGQGSQCPSEQPCWYHTAC